MDESSKISSADVRASTMGLLAGFVVAAALAGCGLSSSPFEKAKKIKCLCHMGNIDQAMQSYALQRGHYPPAHIDDDRGRPMHSWRVLLLPYLDQKAIYDRYRFDEPWDGPNNRKLHDIVIPLYCCPAVGESTNTSYVVVTGPHTAFPGKGEVTPKYINDHDGSGVTGLIVEAVDAGIHWMEPRDLPIDKLANAAAGDKQHGITTRHPGGSTVGLADGKRAFLRNDAPDAMLKALFTIDGGEQIDWARLFE
ncbi:MAG TPA: DUF1559 domain-containing protein [Pirellulales bacterium]|jgi:hypothetical protein|nr:DUF1559 domain-containing protein [Pirellulales bacterium]